MCNFTLETCFRWSFSSSHLAVHSVSLARFVSVIASWDELGLFLVRGFPPINSVARPPNSAGSHLWPTSSWSCEPRACQTSCLALSRTSRWALVLVGEPQQDERPCLPHCSVELLCFWGSPPCPRCTCQGWQVAQGGPIRLRQLLLWLQGIFYQNLVRLLRNNFPFLAALVIFVILAVVFVVNVVEMLMVSLLLMMLMLLFCWWCCWTSWWLC